ncbi:hypothetical protein B0H13DRAFT_1870643 [Mycena leptocephala]|nr:hypothetical protein B0H13DRAFT_1870643 [Mycena leptocephala]
MSFHVLSTLLSASAERFPDTHFILVAESLGLCDPSRTRLLQNLNQLRKVLLADYVYMYPTKADTLIAPGSVDDPATRLQIYIMRQIAPALTSRALRRLLDMHGVKYAATDKFSKLHRHLFSFYIAWIEIKVVPDHLKRKLVRNFNLETSAANLTDKKTLSFEDFDLDLLRRPDHSSPHSRTEPWLDPRYPEPPMPMENPPYASLPIEPHSIESDPDSAEPVVAVCRRCCTDLKANKVPPLSTANNNYLGPRKVLDTEKLLVLGSPKAEILGNMFCGQGKSLVNFLDADRGRKPGIILTERTWAHNNTVMVNTSAYTEMKETGNGEDDDRDVRGPMLGARIGDLMRCAVVMQVEDRSRSEIKGSDIYDWIYRLKANVTERIYDKSDLFAHVKRPTVYPSTDKATTTSNCTLMCWREFTVKTYACGGRTPGTQMNWALLGIRQPSGFSQYQCSQMRQQNQWFHAANHAAGGMLNRANWDATNLQNNQWCMGTVNFTATATTNRPCQVGLNGVNICSQNGMAHTVSPPNRIISVRAEDRSFNAVVEILPVLELLPQARPQVS